METSWYSHDDPINGWPHKHLTADITNCGVILPKIKHSNGKYVKNPRMFHIEISQPRWIPGDSAHDHLPHLRGCAAPSSNNAGVGKPSELERVGSPQVAWKMWHNQALCFVDVGCSIGLISGSSGRRGGYLKIEGQTSKIMCSLIVFLIYLIF